MNLSKERESLIAELGELGKKLRDAKKEIDTLIETLVQQDEKKKFADKEVITLKTKFS